MYEMTAEPENASLDRRVRKQEILDLWNDAGPGIVVAGSERHLY
jgi:hypothetical protein